MRKILMSALLLVMSIGLLVTAPPSQAALQVTWVDNSDNEDGFTIERRIFDIENFELISQVSSGVTVYQDDTPVAGETYCYRVGAFNQAGASYSGQFCITLPTAPIPEPDPEPTPDPDPVPDPEPKAKKGWGKGGKYKN